MYIVHETTLTCNWKLSYALYPIVEALTCVHLNVLECGRRSFDNIIEDELVIAAAFNDLNDRKADIEDIKVEHLTTKYKNSQHGIADKEMLVNIIKQHFPTSSWSHVDSQAGKNYINLDVWRTGK